MGEVYVKEQKLFRLWNIEWITNKELENFRLHLSKDDIRFVAIPYFFEN